MKTSALVKSINNTETAIERTQQMIESYVADATLFKSMFDRHIRINYPIRVLGIRIDPVLVLMTLEPDEYESALKDFVDELKPEQIAKYDLSYSNLLDRLEKLERHLQSLLFVRDHS